MRHNFPHKYRARDYKIGPTRLSPILHFLNELNKIFVFIASKSRVLLFIECHASRS